MIARAAARKYWDVAILDEGHYAKSPDAKRTKLAYGDAIDLKGGAIESATHVWVLTGTPLLNHPGEFWTHLHALRPETILLGGFGPLTYDMFVDRFCVTQTTPRQKKRILGAKNTLELSERVRPFVNRKRIRDVIKDMPPLRVADFMLPADTDISPGLRRQIEEAAEQAFPDADALSDDELLEAVQSRGVQFSTLRRLIGMAKAAGVSALVDDELEEDLEAKIIVFAHHREVIEQLAYNLALHKPLVITGATPIAKRTDHIRAFQEDPDRRLIILAIEAAGEVITLHASHNVIIAEPSPVPAKNHQAIARAYRRGQRNAVLARIVLLPGTLDARLMSIVARKTREIAEVLDNVPSQNIPATALAFPDEP